MLHLSPLDLDIRTAAVRALSRCMTRGTLRVLLYPWKRIDLAKSTWDDNPLPKEYCRQTMRRSRRWKSATPGDVEQAVQQTANACLSSCKVVLVEDAGNEPLRKRVCCSAKSD